MGYFILSHPVQTSIRQWSFTIHTSAMWKSQPFAPHDSSRSLNTFCTATEGSSFCILDADEHHLVQE